jgi:hypothetical protein
MSGMALLEVATILETRTLGELMAAHRASAGIELETISRASGFPRSRVEAVESDQHDLTSTELADLLAHYRVPPLVGRFSSPVVEINLEGGWIAIRATRRRGSRRPTADENLISYLSLVHQYRGLRAGTCIPLKLIDLSILRAALAIRRSDVSAEVDRMTGRIPEGLRRNRSLMGVAAATGIVVTAGAIVLVPAAPTTVVAPGTAGLLVPVAVVASEPDRPDPAITPPTDPRIEIGTALVIERTDSGTIVTESAPAELAPGQADDAQVRIGTAIRIEPSEHQDPSEDRPHTPKTSRGPPAQTEAPSHREGTTP